MRRIVCLKKRSIASCIAGVTTCCAHDRQEWVRRRGGGARATGGSRHDSMSRVHVHVPCLMPVCAAAAWRGGGRRHKPAAWPHTLPWRMCGARACGAACGSTAFPVVCVRARRRAGARRTPVFHSSSGRGASPLDSSKRAARPEEPSVPARAAGPTERPSSAGQTN
eukprot:7383266-Prymnesium_polylepis.1